MIEPVAALLDAACRAGDPPAAACCAIRGGVTIHASAHGGSAESLTTHASVFDVASVTKVAATTVAIARLVREGAISLDDEARRVLPAFPHDATIRALLGHRSGLPGWRPFFRDAMEDPVAGAAFGPRAPTPEAFDAGRRIVLDGVLRASLEVPGRRVYSDLGFLTLGALVEAAGGALDPGRDALGYVDLRAPTPWITGRHVLPTGRTRPREPAPGQEALYAVPPQALHEDAGRVDDDNAFAMGGVAGHAGVFGTARAVAALGMALIDELDGAEALGIGPALMRELVAIDPADGPPRALGFDVPTGPASTAGGLGDGPRGAIGHLGFTGCSLWLDLDRRLAVALLTNRTLDGRHRVDGIRALRPAVHAAIRAAG